jgi:hypothetical protein
MIPKDRLHCPLEPLLPLGLNSLWRAACSTRIRLVVQQPEQQKSLLLRARTLIRRLSLETIITPTIFVFAVAAFDCYLFMVFIPREVEYAKVRVPQKGLCLLRRLF